MAAKSNCVPGFPPADLRLAVSLHERGSDLDLVIPRDLNHLRASRPSGLSKARITSLLAKANVIECYGTGPVSPSERLHCLGLVAGLARLRAEAYVTEAIPLAAGIAAVEPTSSRGPSRWCSALFGDFKGFSKLNDEQVETFTLVVLKVVARCLHRWRRHTLCVNTWGDGLYIALDDPLAAAECAMDLCRATSSIDLPRLGLPSTLGLRLGGHHTCATITRDPVLRAWSVIGRGISMAARIEPITPERAVYISEAFAAAVAGKDKGRRFACEYVGKIPLAKQFGYMRMFRLDHRPNTDR